MATSFFNELMQSLGDRGRSLLGWSREAVRKGDLAEIAEALLSRRGEASGVALARTLLEGYGAASAETRLAFLTALAERFGPDADELQAAVDAYNRDPGPETAVALHEAAEARRQELFRRLNLAPGGTAALVRMREDLLGQLRQHPVLRQVDTDFAHLFSSWFNRGFLTLRPIDWSTPANILEKIIRYEAVHEIQGWDDLRNRLEPPDRRCFGFFHPQLVDVPLIFVEVALTTAMPAAIAPLLDPRREPIEPRDATTAIFYSISNTQAGLGGVSFGNFLIKQVVDDLKRELPNLKTFATLSPVPGFAKWLVEERGEHAALCAERGWSAGLASLDDGDWTAEPAKRETVRRVLTEALATYLLRAKARNGRPLDPVARFHLGNGARLERLDFLGDESAKGMRQSHGMMVNYCYDLDHIEKNHEAFAEKGEVIAAATVRKALRLDMPARELAAAS